MSLSIIGLSVALTVLAPSMLLVFWPPRPAGPAGFSAGVLATALERSGQVGCLALATVTGPQTIARGLDAACAIGVVVLVAGYWMLWLRYVRGGRRVADLFSPVAGVPVPMAVLPVLIFAGLAIWAESAWLALAVTILAAGHLPNSWAGRVATR
ncbi:hypothetical protein [Aeromicrobium sp. P5_D10]